jgi:tryptophan-rich sensory protein
MSEKCSCHLPILLAFILLCLGVGLVGSWLTEQTVHSWYPLIAKPIWTPPNWVFAPVWTILYLLMAVAVWLVWKEPTSENKTPAYTLFGLQLFANLIWSGLFFYLTCPGCALVDIVLLWILIVATIRSFWKIKPLAGFLLIPYLLWTTYAVALNAAVWWLNS